MTSRFDLAGVREPFRAVVRAAVPAAASLDGPGWARLEDIVTDAVSARPRGVQRQLSIFLRLLDLMSLVRHGRRLATLDVGTATRFLGGLERSRLLLLRRGAWGVRTLAFMGYYGQPPVWESLGYRAAPGGWAERGLAAGPWPERGGAGRPEDHVFVAGAGEPDA